MAPPIDAGVGSDADTDAATSVDAGDAAALDLCPVAAHGYCASGVDDDCNDFDDDCDGRVDEEVDLDTSMEHCGACGNECRLLHALDGSQCIGGQCVLDPAGCDPGFWDADGDVANGCEYRCTAASPPAELCDGYDDDCDGRVDEGVEITDSRIGVSCVPDSGSCGTSTTHCGVAATPDGQRQTIPVCTCPRTCTPTAAVDGCGRGDEDCDGDVDEDDPCGDGEPCGERRGECEPGKFRWDPGSGELVCEGGLGPIDEQCDGLDNDCDGSVDEDILPGSGCGTDEGACRAGFWGCLDGSVVCVGEVAAKPEGCDCEDNDCDGAIDEDGADFGICAEGSECVSCQCAVRCRDADVCGSDCPADRVATTQGGDCFCLESACDAATCAQETLRDLTDTIICGPGGNAPGPCVCRNNACTGQCDGVVCPEPLTCDPTNGRCRDMRCTVIGCGADEYCHAATESCRPDPCATANCESYEGCRFGTCFGSCAPVACDAPNRCEDGSCVPDPCARVECYPQVCRPSDGRCVDAGACVEAGCPVGFVCDPVAGTCLPDPCLRTRCPTGQVCERGQCL